jgi:predicted acylesterase/phospholipase RssA
MTADKNDKPKPRRALVLQGGGSLGAYEAGVLKAIYQYLIDEEGENPEKNLFDIVAGTSIGAINAAILVSYVKENKTWEGSVEKLEDFWKKQLSSTPNLSTYGPFYLPYFWSDKSWRKIWDEQHMIKSETATGEAARRYYSTKEFLFSGAPNVFSSEPESPIYDSKFFDNNALLPNNLWFRYDNQPLRESIKKYAKFPIATSSDKEEPRLLLVSVDVEEGETVTFDSYEYKGKECKICEKGFEEDNKKSDNNELIKHVCKDHRKVSYKEGDVLRWSVYGDEHNRHAIFYDGIELDHVIASASVPLNYDYTKIKASKSEINIDNNTFESEEETRHFWDGGLLSNTPLRELIGEHKTFWEKKLGINDSTKLLDKLWEGGGEGVDSELTIPDLDVYIVNLWPPKEYKIPVNDHDVIKDRKNDITYHDKTEYDQKVATFVTDYIDLSWHLIKLAKKNNLPKKDIEKILKKRTKSRQRTGKARRYEDLVAGRFDIRRAVRIERKDDYDTISNKSFDFSTDTIQQLIEKGYKEAQIQIKIESKVQSLIDKINKIIDLHENEKERGKIDQDKITLLERKLLSIKTIYLKQEDDHIEAFKEYLDQFLNRVGNYAIERPEQLTPLMDEVNRFHKNLKEIGVSIKFHK